MAPLPPLGRERVLALIAARSLPLHFGSPHPIVAVVEQDGLFRIRDLVIDPDEAEESRAAALAQHRSWMPEHYYELGRPTGTIHCEAATREELMEQIRAMPWPTHW